jgi:thiosulfate reductase cytochrome b subunit
VTSDGATNRPAGPARRPWSALAWAIPAALLALLVVVLAAKGLRSLTGVQAFLAEFPGEAALPVEAPVGIPAWLAWQHGLNVFFILFIVRSGWLIRTAGRPTVFWRRDNTGLIRTRRPPSRMGLNVWLHLSVDTLWVLNGVVFYVLLVATGQWTRIVPVSADILPNAVSAALQYASLDWPIANGWANYNALQLLSYFTIVFVAAPLALATGLRLSPLWTSRRLSAVVPLGPTRVVHVAVMVVFLVFIAVHVTLVLATGALRNLNHMYGARDDDSWVGFAIFAASLVLMLVACWAATPRLLSRIAARTGTVVRR